MANGDPARDEDRSRLETVLGVESLALRTHFVWCLQEGELSAGDEMRRRETALDEAFVGDPLPLMLDLYARFPARRALSTPSAGLRLLSAAFDAALDRGWLSVLASQDPALSSFNATRYGWKQSSLTQNPVKMSDAQLKQAMKTVGELVAGGGVDPAHKFENWYYYVVRAAVAHHWPKHQNQLVAMFSAGFAGRSQNLDAVARLTEILLQETPLERGDIPELVDFDLATARLEAARASVFAELGDPLAQAMEVVLDNSGFIESKRFPALRALREPSPKRRGEYFSRLVDTIRGLERHGLDHWEKLKRKRGRYSLGLTPDPAYSVQPEMSVLFVELTLRKIDLPDRDAVLSGFLELMPFLIYLPPEQVLPPILETAQQFPEGRTARKLRLLMSKTMDVHFPGGVTMDGHPFKNFRTQIETVLHALPSDTKF